MSQFDLSNITVVKTKEEIENRLSSLAHQIDTDFKGEEIVVVGILKGSFIFYADLIRKMRSEVICEYFGISSYSESKLTSGEVKIILDLSAPVSGKNILLVEDIVSDGLTLNYLARNILAREPKLLRTCCFVKKMTEEDDFNIDYVGFNLKKEDHIIGYGIDYEGRYRNLPYLAKLTKTKE